MSTRSTIARQNEDGTITAIYCHFDGYPSGVGAILQAHYQDAQKVDALIGLGSLSGLGAEIGEAHPFEARYADDDPRAAWCLAYGRDRGEANTDATTFPDIVAYYAARDDYWADYQYLFADGAWFIRSRNSGKVLLSDALAKEVA